MGVRREVSRPNRLLPSRIGCMFPSASALVLDDEQRKRLQLLARSGKAPQKVALRARIPLLAADGTPSSRIAEQLGCSRPTVLLWQVRFRSQGVRGIMKDAQRPGVLSPGGQPAMSGAVDGHPPLLYHEPDRSI